jgi:hypothetical protein
MLYRDLVAVDYFCRPICVNTAARSCIACNLEIHAVEDRHLRFKYVRLRRSIGDMRALILIGSCCVLAKVSSSRLITNRISVSVSERE